VRYCGEEIPIMKTETHDYKGYEIELVQTPPMWQAGIYPKSPDLPSPSKAFAHVTRPTKDGALAEARKRIDGLPKK
jgi:hypothetical protein